LRSLSPLVRTLLPSRPLPTRPGLVVCFADWLSPKGCQPGSSAKQTRLLPLRGPVCTRKGTYVVFYPRVRTVGYEYVFVFYP
jgi:hypothetical protein